MDSRACRWASGSLSSVNAVSSRSHSQQSQSELSTRCMRLADAMRTVFRERIRIIMSESDQGAGELFLSCDCPSLLIEMNKASIEAFIDCPAEYHDWLMNVHLIATKAICHLDDSFDRRLSKTAAKGKQKQWAQRESDKFRRAWSYFMRMCNNSEWSVNSVIMALKLKY